MLKILAEKNQYSCFIFFGFFPYSSITGLRFRLLKDYMSYLMLASFSHSLKSLLKQ